MTTATAALETEDLRAAYRAQSTQALARGLMVLNGLSLLVVPGGFTLDYFLYREHFLAFLALRLGASALLVAFIAWLWFERSRGRPVVVKAIGILSAFTINAAICLMIQQTEGARSPYFVGLTLVLTCWSTLSPWSVRETSILCLATLVAYLASCVTSASFGANAASYAQLGFGAFFIVITTVVCVGITLYLSRARFEDFRLRHQLDAQNRKLQDLDRLKTQFFSNVSHELRTPLTLILSPVESLLARGDALDARVHEALILVHRNSLRLLKLINDLLDLTRLDEGGEAPRRAAVTLGPWLRGVVESVRHLGLGKQLRFRVEPGDEAAIVQADAARLEKVLLNLLTNAIKYTPAGGTITVRWRATAEAVIIEVSDTGVGIPETDRERVFDRFHQVRNNATNRVQGVGIGLALARELVQAHGGELTVDSEVGRGSTFRIALPADPPPESDAGEEERAVTSDEPFAKAFRAADLGLRTYADPGADDALPVRGTAGEVVLVADDENDMREFLVAMLAENYRVVQTRHGGNVAALVAEHRPALALLDWMMPEKDGLAVCRELRADPANADLKIMLLTARIDERSKLDALAGGADDFLTKPFSSVEVRTRVSNLLRAAVLQRDLRASNAELRATVEKLQRTEFLLIQSEKMNAIGSLSAGLLHEINNPLNYTLTALSVMDRVGPSMSADMRDLVTDIREGMERIRDVVTHLRTFAYPEKPDQQSVVPIAEAFRDARKLLAKEMMEIEFDVSLPDDLVVRGQRTQLMHLFVNLLGNAGRALAERPPGSERGRIIVRAETAEGMLMVSVADNGPGIPAEILNRVFEPFFTTREVGSGMGLGLSICQTIMESHGGGIRVGNRPEGGAVFTFHLPLATPSMNHV